MPATSGPQYRKMAANCFGKGMGREINKKVACEFVHKTSASKRRLWSKKKKGS